jgi:TPP-dependent pyruvate/acetoin dehydrogenase alpha subunit
MGKATGVCGGRGGSQHLHYKDFYSNGVQGGVVPVATGMALAEKVKGSQAVVIAFLGDGTLGEGVVYESLNLASLWSLPILYVVENNHIAQTTPTEQALAGSLAGRFSAFNLPVTELSTSDVLPIQSTAEAILGEIRQRCAPQALILNTYRFGPHSKGDDTRPVEVVNRLRLERDPLAIHGSRLSEAERTTIEEEIRRAITAAFQQALSDPFPAFAPGESQ